MYIRRKLLKLAGSWRNYCKKISGLLFLTHPVFWKSKMAAALGSEKNGNMHFLNWYFITFSKMYSFPIPKNTHQNHQHCFISSWCPCQTCIYVLIGVSRTALAILGNVTVSRTGSSRRICEPTAGKICVTASRTVSFPADVHARHLFTYL